MKLVFSSIKNGNIFEPEFQSLTPAFGTIEFKHMSTPGGIAVVYAPNGTGKSSLAKMLGENATDEVSFAAVDDRGAVVTADAFHIIPDQIRVNWMKRSTRSRKVNNHITI